MAAKWWRQAPTWTGQLTEYANLPVLEGADQPPFYPALFEATVHVDAVEKVVNGPTLTVAQYDGHYMRYGFLSEAKDTENAALNKDEVFLDFRKVVRQHTGSNGDRVAGLAHPDANYIAFSRKKGPLGANGEVFWLGFNGERKTQTIPDKPEDDKEFDIGGFDAGLVSLVKFFASAPNPTLASTPTTNAAILPPPGDAQAKLEEARVLLTRYFDPKAKLLGVVTLKKLIEMLVGELDLPALKQTVQYGTAALAAVDQFIGEVRTRVLLPLRAVLVRLSDEWAALDGKLKTSGSTASMSSLFPEVGQGMKAVVAALDAAITTDDKLALQARLAEVYASGRQLIRNLEILASHPIERLEAALGAALNAQVATLLDTLAQTPALEKFAELRNLAKDPDKLADLVATQADLVIPLPLPNLPAILSAVLPDDATGAAPFRTAVANIQADLARELPISTAEVLRPVLRAVLGGTKPADAVKTTLRDRWIRRWTSCARKRRSCPTRPPTPHSRRPIPC